MVEAPLVALHGFTQGPSAFSELEVPFVSAPFLSGHGPSPDLHSKSFEEEVSRLARLFEDALGGIRGHLLAYSMGARLGLGLLLRHPQLFAQATLIGLNPGLTTSEERKARLDWERDWTHVLMDEGLTSFAARWRNQEIFSTQNALSPEQRSRQDEVRLSHTSEGLIHALEILGLGAMPNYWNELESLSVPTLLLVGSEDTKFVELACAAEKKNSLICARKIPGAGHNVVLEAADSLRSHLLSGRPYESKEAVR